MLRAFFLLLSLVTDYNGVAEIAHQAFIVGVVNAAVVSLILARLVFRARRGRPGGRPREHVGMNLPA